MEFNEMISAERARRGLSLRTASALVGISHTYLDALEKGRDPRNGGRLVPSQDVVFKLCKAYDLDFSLVLPYMQIHDEYEFYMCVAKKISTLKRSKPSQYRELLAIVEGKDAKAK